MVYRLRVCAGELKTYVQEELNVQSLLTCSEPLQYATLRAAPDFKVPPPPPAHRSRQHFSPSSSQLTAARGMRSLQLSCPRWYVASAQKIGARLGKSLGKKVAAVTIGIKALSAEEIAQYDQIGGSVTVLGTEFRNEDGEIMVSLAEHLPHHRLLHPQHRRLGSQATQRANTLPKGDVLFV